MKPVLKTPCKGCPFLKSSLPGWLGPYKNASELHLVVMSEAHFNCHTENPEQGLDPESSDGKAACVGALLYMKKCAKTPRDPHLVELTRHYSGLESENVFDLGELHKHHSEENMINTFKPQE